jgi:hypothetical protein
LRCEPIGGQWNTTLGSRSRFYLKIPLIEPTLKSTVVERKPGTIVWEFQGFFQGRDRWECRPNKEGTLLVNRFEFNIANSVIAWGFNNFAANWTKNDMKAQLRRLKKVAEEVYMLS